MRDKHPMPKNGRIPLLVASLALSACSTTPMQARFEKNFVYKCTLEMMNKNVSPADAEKICASSHKAELQERAAKRSPASLPEPDVDETEVGQ